MPTDEEEVVETFDCPHCGEEYEDEDDATNVLDDQGNVYCVDCSLYMFSCDWCNGSYHPDNMDHVYSEAYNETVCSSCMENEGFSCVDCGWVYHYDDSYYDEYADDGPRCADCYENGSHGRNEYIRRWGDRPQIEYIHTYGKSMAPMSNEYYFGMEIEIHGLEPHHVQDAHEVNAYHGWTTTDATVAGFEMVTFPGTFDAWRHDKVIDFDRWYDTIHARVPDQTQYTDNGIHVHVSRTAFNHKRTGKQSSAHLFKWMSFIQTHDRALHSLAGRTDSNYCGWDYERDLRNRKEEATGKATYSERYRPINTQNDHTLEVRIFDGRTDKAFIMRAIEFLHATIEFTRGLSGKLPDWLDFEEYVKARSDLYPEVVKWMETKDSYGILPRDLAITSKVISRPLAKRVYGIKKREKEQERIRQREREAARARTDAIIDAVSQEDACTCGICASGRGDNR